METSYKKNKKNKAGLTWLQVRMDSEWSIETLYKAGFEYVQQ